MARGPEVLGGHVCRSNSHICLLPPRASLTIAAQMRHAPFPSVEPVPAGEASYCFEVTSAAKALSKVLLQHGVATTPGLRRCCDGAPGLRRLLRRTSATPGAATHACDAALRRPRLRRLCCDAALRHPLLRRLAATLRCDAPCCDACAATARCDTCCDACCDALLRRSQRRSPKVTSSLGRAGGERVRSTSPCPEWAPFPRRRSKGQPTLAKLRGVDAVSIDARGRGEG